LARRPAKKPKPPPRRLSKRHPYESTTEEGKARQLANLTQAGRMKGAPQSGEVRHGTNLVGSKQPEMLVGLDGTTFEMRYEWFLAAVEDAGVAAPAFNPLVLIAAMILHHWLCCEPLFPSMSYNDRRIHERRYKNVLKSLGDLGLTATSAQSLGLMQAREMQARRETMQVKPVRTRERAVEVSRLLSEFGVIPPAEAPVDATVVEDAEPEPEPDTDYGGDTPPPLPESDARDLGVRSIFDRKM
jgi:hypothetical protein